MGKSEGLRAELEDRSSVLDSEKRAAEQELAGTQSELAVLRSVLEALQGDRSARVQEHVSLQNSKQVSKAAYDRVRQEVDQKEAQVGSLRAQKKAVQAEKADTLDKVRYPSQPAPYPHTPRADRQGRGGGCQGSAACSCSGDGGCVSCSCPGRAASYSCGPGASGS